MRYKHIIFDFDGVLVESNSIRFEGFRRLFNKFSENNIEQFLKYVILNGGLSRYEKIGYFFEKIRHEVISPDNVLILAERYSGIVKQKVISAAPVRGAEEFLNSHFGKCDFAVVSGSDQAELREICRERGIDSFFVDILGSPAGKGENIADLLSRAGWDKRDCVFVGDSINDLDAARVIGIAFIARDSGTTDWRLVKDVHFIGDLSELESCLNSLDK